MSTFERGAERGWVSPVAREIPREQTLDSTRALLSEGYRFIQNRCRRLDSDVFETRLMLRSAYCATGEDAARMFYEPGRFTRRGALPPTTLRLLQDEGSVATLDGEAHRHRKRMFMSLVEPAKIDALATRTGEEWRAAVARWAREDEVVLHEQVQEILCRAVCAWAGLPLPEAEVAQRTREVGAMIGGPGAVGPRMWGALLLRARAERWVRDVVAKLRAGTIRAPESSAAQVIASHRDLDGALLDPRVVAVELLNVIRPTVAVARFVTFAALALHAHPDLRQRLRGGDDDLLEPFAHEVRRFYPFFPAVGGRARHAFEWRGWRFDRGTWFLLDLYGTNHDSRIWEAPNEFRPERFVERNISPYGFIPQGGGSHQRDHRCAGEWLTIALLKVAVRSLLGAMEYEVPKQDLHVPLSRVPTLPASGFVIRDVRTAS